MSMLVGWNSSSLDYDQSTAVAWPLATGDPSPTPFTCPFGLDHDKLVKNAGLIFGFTLLTIMTFLGNLMIILAICMDPRLNTASNQYYLGLATADMLVGVFSMPMMLVATVHGCWPLGKLMCDLWTSQDSLNCISSFLTLCFIAYDRYSAVSDPFKHMRTQSKRKVRVHIIIIWVTSVFVWLPFIFGLGVMSGNNVATYSCEFLPGLLISIGGSFLTYYIPITFMVYYYVKLYRIIRKTLRSGVSVGGEKVHVEVGKEISIGGDTSVTVISDSTTGDTTSITDSKNPGGDKYGKALTSKREADEQKQRAKKEQRAARTLGVIMTAFILSWSVWIVTWPLKNARPDALPDWMFELACWLACGNSSLNPFLYVFSNKDFRLGCLRVINKLFCRRRR